MFRPALREYESAIAASPTRHAILNRPFTVLRRRTETLLDQITGANVAQEVKADQRQHRERDRANRCRSCRMIFADESALSGHYKLFPAHTIAPESKQKQKSRAQDPIDDGAAVGSRRKRTQSTPGLLEDYAAARSSTSHQFADHFADAGPSRHVYDDAKGHGGAYVAEPASEKQDYQGSSFAQYGHHQRSITADAITQSYETVPPYQRHDDLVASPTAFASPDMALAYRQEPVTPREKTLPARYDEAEASSSANSGPVPALAPMLPLPPVVADTSFAETFERIEKVGIDSPLQYTKPLPDEKAGFDSPERYEKALPIPDGPSPLYDGPAPDYESVAGHSRKEGKMAEGSQSAMRRGRPDRGMRCDRSTGTIDGLMMPSTFGDVIRAVVATGARGDDGSAVMPMSQDRVAHSAQLYGAAGNDENMRPKTDWSKLFGGLPGSAQADREEREARSSPTQEVRPVLTGLTSFSQDVDDSTWSPTASPSTRSRSNTNPFANRNFMRSLPNALQRTPPLTPSSPYGYGAQRNSPFFRAASSSNAFIALPGDEDAAELFYDADEPKTPGDALNQASSSTSAVQQGRKSFSLPFSSRRMHSRAASTDALTNQTKQPLATSYARSGLDRL